MSNNKEGWVNFRYFSRDPYKLIESETIRNPIRMKVPQLCLNGTQPKEEYSRKKERRVKQLYTSKGVAILEQFPIILCAVPQDESDFIQTGESKIYDLALLDGHHRVRYGPIYNVHQYPAIILSLGQAANLYQLSLQDFLFIIREWIASTTYSFSQHLPNRSSPRSVSFIQEAQQELSLLIRG